MTRGTQIECGFVEFLATNGCLGKLSKFVGARLDQGSIREEEPNPMWPTMIFRLKELNRRFFRVSRHDEKTETNF